MEKGNGIQKTKGVGRGGRGNGIWQEKENEKGREEHSRFSPIHSSLIFLEISAGRLREGEDGWRKGEGRGEDGGRG